MNTSGMTDIVARSVLDALPCGILVFDGDGQLLFVSAHAFRMVEVDPAMMAPGISLADAVRRAAYRGLYGPGHPDEQADTVLNLDRTRHSQRLIRGLDDRWFDLNSVPLADGGFAAFVVEVTNLKQTELAATQRANQIEAAFNALSEGVALFDSEQRLILNNAAFRTVIGADAKALSDRPTLAELTERLRRSGALTASPDQDLAKILGATTVRSRSGHYARATGSTVQYTFSTALDAGFVLAVDDITALRQAEGEARRRTAVLEALIAALPHGVSVYGPDRRLVMFNDAYARIMEGAPATVGEHLSDILRRFAETGEFGPGDPAEILRIESGFLLNRPQMRQRVRPNGTVLDVRTAPLPDGGHLSVITDISAIFRAEEEARSRSAVLETMLGTMRHGVMLFGPDRRLIAANHLAARLAGHEPDDLVPGALHDDLVQHLYDKGELRDEPESRALLEQALYRDRTVPTRHTRRGYDGRMLEVAFDPTADGGFVITYADITPLAHAEEEAQQRAEIQRAMLDNLRVGVQMYDADSRLVASNALGATLAGLPAGAFRTGRMLADILGEAVRSGQMSADQAERILADDRRVPFRHRRQRPDGVLLEVTSDPTPDGGFVVVLNDVTALAQAEAEVQRRAALMQAMLDNMQAGVLLYDADHRLVAFNALAERLAGLPPGTYQTGLLMDEMITTAVRAGHIDANGIEPALTMDRGIPRVFRRRRPDGAMLEIASNPTPDGGFVVVVSDVTKLADAEAEAEHQAQLMRAMLANIRQGIILFDADGRVLAANGLARTLTGLPADGSLEGLTITELGRLQVETGEISADESRRLGEYRPSPTMRTGRYERTRPNGMVLAVATDPTPGGGFVRTYTDVTEDHRMRMELEAARAAAEGASLANTRLVASLAEELRAKLNVIIGLSEALHAGAASSAAQDPARAILRASQDLLALVDSKAAAVGVPPPPAQ